jgi:hypothetical protein
MERIDSKNLENGKSPMISPAQRLMSQQRQ